MKKLLEAIKQTLTDTDYWDKFISAYEIKAWVSFGTILVALKLLYIQLNAELIAVAAIGMGGYLTGKRILRERGAQL